MKSRARDPRTVERVRILIESGERRADVCRKMRMSINTLDRITKAFGITCKERRFDGRAKRDTNAKKHRLAMLERHNAKARRKRRRHWSSEEVTWLKENEKTVTAQDAALHLGRTVTAVRYMIRKLGLAMRGDVQWSYAEDEYLVSNFHLKSIREIATKLKRDYHAVYFRAQTLGLGTVSERIHRDMLTVKDIALRFNVAEDTVYHWARHSGMPSERIGQWIVTSDDALTEWLEAGNILRTDRAGLTYRDRVQYDRVRSQMYALTELRALDMTFVTCPHQYAAKNEAHKALVPSPIHVGQGKRAEYTYYRKSEVLRWAYLYGHLIPDNVAHPDFADVLTAWLTMYVTSRELRLHFSNQTQCNWVEHHGFPKAIVNKQYYDRAAIIAWLRSHKRGHIAAKLTRGKVLCYDELIRARQRRAESIS